MNGYLHVHVDIKVRGQASVSKVPVMSGVQCYHSVLLYCLRPNFRLFRYIVELNAAQPRNRVPDILSRG